VTPTRHGVTWDSHIEDSYPNVPTLFELARRAGYTTAIVTGKTKLIVLTKPGTLNWSYLANEDREDDSDVARHAVATIRDHRPDVLFIHLGNFDTVGHASGWGSQEQMRALKQADDAFGAIDQALSAARLTASTVMIPHGRPWGEPASCILPRDPRSQFIPWIAAGPSIRRNFEVSRDCPGAGGQHDGNVCHRCAPLLGINIEQPWTASPCCRFSNRH
jgi:hypothetical protein